MKTYVPTAQLAELLFKEAANAWLATREGHLAPRTFLDYGYYIKTLALFFGELRLPEITGDDVRSYQEMRSSRAGAGLINKECLILRQMRERIGQPLLDYQPLKLPKDYETPGRRLTTDEERVLEKMFRAAVDHPRWNVAALTSLMSMKSGLGPGEMRSLKLQDCSLDPPQVTIPRRGAKRPSRERLVVLNDTAAWALEMLIARAVNTCGCSQPSHYLIPAMRRNHSYDPTQPCCEDGWRTALKELLSLAEIDIRAYDLRHHAVSVALGNPKVSKQDARAYFGWISDKMFQRYGHAELAGLKVVAAAMDHKAALKRHALPASILHLKP